MLRGWLANGMDPASILVIDPAARDVPSGVSCVEQAPTSAPKMLLLGIKPQMLEDVAPSLSIGPETLVVSILAGVEVATLAQHLPGAQAYARVMPNMPAAIGEGVSVLYAPTLDGTGRSRVEALVAPLGLVQWVEDESLFHAVTGVSGSGPAFVLRFAEALAKAGEAEGLSSTLSLTLALHTLAGSARLALATDRAPADLVETVRSPNGTTHAGLEILDHSDFSEIVRRTVKAAADRSRALAEGAKPN